MCQMDMVVLVYLLLNATKGIYIIIINNYAVPTAYQKLESNCILFVFNLV